MRIRPHIMAYALVYAIAFTLTAILPASAEKLDSSNHTTSLNQINVAEQGLGDADTGEILVKFKPSLNAAQTGNDNRKVGAQKMEEVNDLKIQRVKLKDGVDEDAAVAAYKKMSDVLYVEPNRRRAALQVPNDTSFNAQWALQAISAPAGWDITVGDSNIIIAVIDTGVYYNHEDLAGKVIKGYDFVNNDNDPLDDNGHGTHVAGIAAATANNGKGIAGISWNSRILAIKVLDNLGYGYDSDIASAITYAADNGARVINMSLGGPGYSQTVADAIQYARSKGCVVVAAAGNENTSAPLYPAAYPNVIGVAATDQSDAKASFSNYGDYVDIAAPGVSIRSSYNQGISSYADASGTSMASPHVAGLAALVAAKFPFRSPDQITRSIEEMAVDLGPAGRDDSFGYGKIDVRRTAEQDIESTEEQDANVVYAGVWSLVPSGYSSSGGYKSSATTGNFATLSFNGSGISWVAKKGPSAGIARVYIDDAAQTDIDLYAPGGNWQQVVYKAENLSMGSHTIRVEVTGAKNGASSGTEVTIDAFDIFGTAESPAPDTTPPTPPGYISASINRSGEVVLTWGGASDNYGVDSYVVERSRDGRNFTGLIQVPGISYIDTNVAAKTRYYYRVKAVDISGNVSAFASRVVYVKTIKAPKKPSTKTSSKGKAKTKSKSKGKAKSKSKSRAAARR